MKDFYWSPTRLNLVGDHKSFPWVSENFPSCPLTGVRSFIPPPKKLNGHSVLSILEYEVGHMSLYDYKTKKVNYFNFICVAFAFLTFYQNVLFYLICVYWWVHCKYNLCAKMLFVYLMVFNTTFNNASVISWRSDLLLE